LYLLKKYNFLLNLFSVQKEGVVFTCSLKSYCVRATLIKLISAFCFIIIISYIFPTTVCGQKNKGDNNIAADSVKKAEPIEEWKEIFSLRKKFHTNQYGSKYIIGLFDGRFIGPNNKDNYGVRTFTTAYDYLIFGNSLLSMLANLGYTADKINFLPGNKVENHHPYMLGCISHYAISQDKYMVDSAYNQNVGKNVAIEKPFQSTIPHLRIDSGQVKADLAGFYIKNKSGKKTIYDTLIFPQIEGTGSWKDANNFDMTYEWFETFFLQYCDSIEIAKRQFSVETPAEVQQCILQRFNTEKYLKENNITVEHIPYRLIDNYKNEVYDMLHQPNEKVLRMGKYELFRYFNDIYWRDVNETVVIKGKGRNLNGELEAFAYSWTPGDRKNPVWHCAFQYDKDSEINSKTGLLNFVMMPYGTKGRNMPTIIPNDFPPFSQFEGVIIWKEGCEKQTYSNSDDIRLNTLNGRMINQGFYCYAYEPGILPLNDDGTVDGIYKIYVWKDDKIYWAYIFCGKHAGIRGGKPGKSFVGQVESFKKNYSFADYWYFYKDLNFGKEVTNNMEGIINKLHSLEKKETGIAGKTLLRINIPITIANSKNPKKSKTDNYYILLNPDNTGTLYPEEINFAWRIDAYDDYKNNMMVKKKSVILNIGGQDVVLEELEDYITSTNFTPSEVKRANKEFAIYLENKSNKEPVENLNEIYNNNIYNLGNSDETGKLIEIIKEDLSAVRYEIPKAERTLINWQNANADRMDELKNTLKQLEENKKTKKETYIKTKEEYDNLKLAEDKKTFQYNKLVAREGVLTELLQRCNERLGINLDNDLAEVQSRINFLTAECKKYEAQLKQLKVEGKNATEYYEQVQTSINNKKQELSEAEDKKVIIERLIQNHKKMQSVE